MKKILIKSILLFSFCVGLTACTTSSNNSEDSNSTNNETTDTTLTVGATSVPHAEILNQIVDDMAEKGINLVVKEFSEYTVLNPSLSSGEIDANLFQHTAFLNNYIEETGDSLTVVGPTIIAPMGIYSKQISSLDQLENGAKVSIPNDATNGGRALMLLDSNGIIKLKEGVGEKATIFDIEENIKDVEIIEADAASLPRTLDDVAISVINTNYALEAGFNPNTDSLAIESSDSPFANVLVVRQGDETKPEITALYEALTSDKIRTFIEETYEGSIIPVF